MSPTSELETRRLPSQVAACRLDALESQAVFKTMMDTISRPGSVGHISEVVTRRVPACIAPILVLADVETRVHVIDAPTFSWQEAVVSATGSCATDLGRADLIAVPRAASEQLTAVFTLASTGNATSPESGARIVVDVDDIRSHGAGRRAGVELVLRGPGIDGETVICLDGLSDDVVDIWTARNEFFPAGFDVWLTAHDGRIAAIPRSTRIEIVATWPNERGM